MTILRFLLILLLTNALAFAAIGGWLGGEPATGEAARIATQLHPERIRLANETGATGPARLLPPAAPLPRCDGPRRHASVVETAPMATAATDTSDDAIAEAPRRPTAVAVAATDTGPRRDRCRTLRRRPSSPRSSPRPPSPPWSPPPRRRRPALRHAWGELSASEAVNRLAQCLRRIGITATRSRSETPEAWCTIRFI